MNVTAPAAPSCTAPARSADIFSSPNPQVGSSRPRVGRGVPAEPLGHEGFISKRELARRLNKSLRTIVYWQRHGIIPYIKCGRSALFKWTDVIAHLEKNFRVCRQLPQKVRSRHKVRSRRREEADGCDFPGTSASSRRRLRKRTFETAPMTNNQPFLVTHSNRSRGFSNR